MTPFRFARSPYANLFPLDRMPCAAQRPCGFGYVSQDSLSEEDM
jgi:hypothetical protein